MLPNKTFESIVGQTTDELMQYFFPQAYLTYTMAIGENILEKAVPSLGGFHTSSADVIRIPHDTLYG